MTSICLIITNEVSLKIILGWERHAKYKERVKREKRSYKG